MNDAVGKFFRLATDKHKGEFFAGAPDRQCGAKGAALRKVAEDADFVARVRNPGFVLMQYFGYLRRNPDDAPEPGLNFNGYNFWLSKLNSFGGDYRAAELVKAFITSGKYRQRFRQP